MARQAREIFIDIPHHLTQRGNYRQQVFFTDDDYLSYLEFLWEYAVKYGLEIWAYCLMPNHVHLIAVPHTLTACARTLGLCHMRYAQVRHRQTHCAGHLWQGRFFSAPLDELYCARAMRYVEMNPQRAGLVTTPEAWPWSSAACHLQGTRLPGATFPPDDMLSNWSAFLLREELPGTLDNIRHCTASGRPLGDAAFYTRIEALGGKPLQRNLHRRPTKNT